MSLPLLLLHACYIYKHTLLLPACMNLALGLLECLLHFLFIVTERRYREGARPDEPWGGQGAARSWDLARLSLQWWATG